jgi:cytochrome b561
VSAPHNIEQNRYTHTAIALHWVMAIIILANLVIGWTFPEAVAGQKFPPKPLLPLHISLGLSALVLIVARIAWRMGHRPPPHHPPLSGLERIAAQLGHLALYALTFVIPFSGWLVLSAHKVQKNHLMLFGLIEWPHFPIFPTLPPANVAQWHDRLVAIHALAASLALPALLAVHVGAVAKHHLIDRHNVLVRMWLKR